MFISRYMKRFIAAGLLAFLFFTACDKNSSGNDNMSEQKTFKVTIENVFTEYKFIESGVYNTPVGAAQPGPLLPGHSFEFTFDAGPGQKLSFVSMFGASNDLFYGPGESGIALYDMSGNPMSGDVTSQVMLWDAGTEINQEPGLGPDQAPRQPAPNTGAADPVNQVRLAPDDFNNLPAVNEALQVTLTHMSGTTFKLTIENVSTSGTLMTSDGGSQPVPVSPGAYVVHSADAPLFTVGMPAPDNGLEALAEDGNPSMLGMYLSDNTGLTSPIAPGLWVVHTSADPLFTSGQPDRGEGLEALAEDADPSALAAAVAGESGIRASGVFSEPVGSMQAGPILPGHSYEFTVTASAGDMLSFATMLGQSNDLFFGPGGNGIELFEADGGPVMGDVTSQVMLWDAGSEVNQKPGVGPDQAPRQAGPNTGADENGNVMPVNDGFSYPDVPDMIKVTLEVQ